VNLLATYYILKAYFRKELAAAIRPAEAAKDDDSVSNPRQAKLAVYATVATLAGFVLSEALRALGVVDLSLSVVAMLGAAGLYAVSSERTQILKAVDYSVLVFFAAMFVVTTSMWSSGAVSIITGWLPEPSPAEELQSMGVITMASLSLSQVLSNVPFVDLYNFVMIENGFTGEHVAQWLMLAAASTVAGNLTILGAASNVIIIESAEARGVRAFGFVEFAKIGSIITATNVLVYFGFLMLVL
jgi:Na+/H+ antiporter NhaD/arsenite permease-like protein